jgi:hypothetical protein
MMAEKRVTIDIRKQGDWLPSKRKSTMASFAEDPNLRGGGGRYEDVTNDLQKRLLGIYDRWAIETRKQILESQDRQHTVSTFDRIIAGRLHELESNLIKAQELGIDAAMQVALAVGDMQSVLVQTAINKLKQNAITGIRDSLIENIRTRLSNKITQAEQFDRSSLKDMFDSARFQIASGSGLVWNGIFLALHAAGRERERRAGLPQRVRWVLNDLAEHCSESPGRFGCPSQAGIYDSWSELETVPAGLVTCRGNCRCRLEVETAPGSNVWQRGLPGFNP